MKGWVGLVGKLFTHARAHTHTSFCHEMAAAMLYTARESNVSQPTHSYYVKVKPLEVWILAAVYHEQMTLAKHACSAILFFDLVRRSMLRPDRWMTCLPVWSKHTQSSTVLKKGSKRTCFACRFSAYVFLDLTQFVLEADTQEYLLRTRKPGYSLGTIHSTLEAFVTVALYTSSSAIAERPRCRVG